jgi:hypothetical protein
VIRIAITPAAFEAIAATLPFGSAGCEAEAKGERRACGKLASCAEAGRDRGPGRVSLRQP